MISQRAQGLQVETRAEFKHLVIFVPAKRRLGHHRQLAELRLPTRFDLKQELVSEATDLRLSLAQKALMFQTVHPQ